MPVLNFFLFENFFHWVSHPKTVAVELVYKIHLLARYFQCAVLCFCCYFVIMQVYYTENLLSEECFYKFVIKLICNIRNGCLRILRVVKWTKGIVLCALNVIYYSSTYSMGRMQTSFNIFFSFIFHSLSLCSRFFFLSCFHSMSMCAMHFCV